MGTSRRPRSATTSSWCAMTACSSSPAWAAASSKPTWTPSCSTHCQPSASASSRPSWLGCAADQLWGAVGRCPAAGLTLLPAQVYPRGVPEEQLRLITSLVYLYSRSEIGQWNITSRDTVVALLASDVALENQTEVRAARAGVGRAGGAPPLARLTRALRPGCPTEVPGPQRHHHQHPAHGHRGLPPLLDERQADPGHQARGVPVSQPRDAAACRSAKEGGAGPEVWWAPAAAQPGATHRVV